MLLPEPALLFADTDDAYLCKQCDEEIHLSNPLAARHERIPLRAIEVSFWIELILENFFPCVSLAESRMIWSCPCHFKISEGFEAL